ncbi:MAG: hypothetical protein J6386_13165 [Candidatus Synoicihabitans palmerolidicus]|nr:hypothetical protein [Candidatus Synoicihabitans palmerolidicus]
MSLSTEQTLTVTQWVKDGATLSEVLKRILEEFKLSMTYMDVRFLVDDLDLTLVDHAPKADASDVSKAPPSKPKSAPDATDDLVEDAEALPVVGSVVIDLDHVSLIPGAIASGSVTFSDGVTGKWIVDNQGRPGFTEVIQDGYQPTPEDVQTFMQELGATLRQKGMA